MDYGMIGKIEKAKMYAQERNRFEFQSLTVSVKGDNANEQHHVSYDEGKWHCDCEFFISRGVCSHTMAVERLLSQMVEIGTVETTPA